MRLLLGRLPAVVLLAWLALQSVGPAGAEAEDDASSTAASNSPDLLDALLRRATLEANRGDYRAAAATFEQARPLAEAAGDKARLASVLAGLGNAEIAIGSTESSRRNLAQAIDLAREAGDRGITAAALNDFGNLLVYEEKYEDASARYLEAATQADAAGDVLLAARARANAASVALQLEMPARAEDLLARALGQTKALPPSRDKAFLLTNLGRTGFKLGKSAPERRAVLYPQAHAVLQEAAALAASEGDDRTASYALGFQAETYETLGQTDEALALTRRALFAAQAAKAPESLYLWHWQAGRLLRAQGKIDAALDSYRLALKEIDGLRLALTSTRGGSGLSFRESVGPVYFEFVDLLLQTSARGGDPVQAQDLLVQARKTVETFKAAELRDYFQDDCVDALQAKVRPLDAVAQTEAVVYPIVLSDRLELLLTLPPPVGLVRYTVPVDGKTLVAEVRRFRDLLEKRTTREYLVPARTLYGWLIRPYAAKLAELGVDTLIFVPDGALRTIPMSALYDGDQALIERYAVATTPGWNLTDPRPLDRKQLKPLLLGLSQATAGYPALPHVSEEIRSVHDSLGGEVLLNEDFLLGSVEKQLEETPFGIVHIASHGEFKSKAEESFLLTYDGNLTMGQLARGVAQSKYRDQPLELLMLSACETAAGDDRAALGLAGVAIKAGARSALGTLWPVDDEAAALLVGDFYRNLKDPGVSRAKALQTAQKNLVADRRYGHPGFWSAFLLISSWL